MAAAPSGASYAPDFSESDPGYGGATAVPPLDLYAGLADKAAAQRITRGTAGVGDYLRTAARVPGHLVSSMLHAVVSGATAPGDQYLEGIGPKDQPINYESVEMPGIPGLIMKKPAAELSVAPATLRRNELISRTLDTAGLATVGGGLSSGLSRGVEALGAGASREGAGAGAAALAGRREPLYSHAERVVEEVGPKIAPPGQWVSILKNKGVKTEELAPIEEWLQSHSQTGTNRPAEVPKSAVLALIRESTPQIKEVWKGEVGSVEDAINYIKNETQDMEHGAPNLVGMNDQEIYDIAEQLGWSDTKGDKTSQTKHHQWQVPGGENYREMLLTLPVETLSPKIGETSLFNGDGRARWQGRILVDGVTETPFTINNQEGRITYWPKTFNWKGDEAAAKYVVNSRDIQNAQFDTMEQAVDFIPKQWNETRGTAAGSTRTDVYRSSHWPDDPNTFAHTRMNDRWLGEPTLEQTQAHLTAQQDHSAALQRASDSFEKVKQDIDQYTHKRGQDLTRLETQDLERQYERAQDLVRRVSEAAPQPPRGSQRTLLLEELQSDWHQTGRKQGYTDKVAQAERERLIAERERTAAEGKYILGHPDQPMASHRLEEINRRLLELPLQGGVVPDAPFKKTWPELLLKRMVREAAEKGYDNLAWTDGATQADRYDLSKQVDSLHYDPTEQRLLAWKDGRRVIDERGVEPNKLDTYIGKEAADKLLKAPIQENYQRIQKLNMEGHGRNLDTPGRREYIEAEPGRFHVLSGLDLRVGGEGMAGFYDQMLPRMANKLFGRWGGKVKQERINAGMSPRELQSMKDILEEGGFEREYLEGLTPAQLAQEANDMGIPSHQEAGAKTIHVLPITPELRQQATQHGFSLFAGGGRKGAGIGAAALASHEGTPHNRGMTLRTQRERPRHGQAAMQFRGHVYTADFHAQALDKFLALHGYPRAKDGGIDLVLRDHPEMGNMTSDNWGGIGRDGGYVPFTRELGEAIPMPVDLHRAAGGRVDMRAMVAARASGTPTPT